MKKSTCLAGTLALGLVVPAAVLGASLAAASLRFDGQRTAEAEAVFQRLELDALGREQAAAN